MHSDIDSWRIDDANAKGLKGVLHHVRCPKSGKRGYNAVPCLKILDVWVCIECGEKAPEEMQFVADLTFTNTSGQVANIVYTVEPTIHTPFKYAAPGDATPQELKYSQDLVHFEEVEAQLRSSTVVEYGHKRLLDPKGDVIDEVLSTK